MSETTPSKPVIHVEFFGIPRRRAGCAAMDVTAETLREALLAVVVAAPGVSEICQEGRLCKGYAANLNGRRFVSSGETRLADGDQLLILSADLGG